MTIEYFESNRIIEKGFKMGFVKEVTSRGNLIVYILSYYSDGTALIICKHKNWKDGSDDYCEICRSNRKIEE